MAFIQRAMATLPRPVLRVPGALEHSAMLGPLCLFPPPLFRFFFHPYLSLPSLLSPSLI